MTTLLGVLIGAFFFLYAIIEQGGLKVFWDLPAVMIVGGGTLAAILISYPLPRVMRVSGVILQIFKSDVQKPAWVIKLMVELSFKARQKSLLALEDEVKKVDNRFLKLGLELVVDGQPANIVREVLETELDFVQVRHRSGEHMFRTASRFTPAFGLIGTLIGLVAMLKNIGSASEGAAKAIGQGMAVGLIGTFYGATLANLVLIPIAEKLRSRSDDEILVNRIILEGVLMIQGGVNPRIIERKLNSFLPPEHRAMYYEQILKESKQRAAARAQAGSGE